MTERIPYPELPTEGKLALHHWLNDHNVDFTLVPVDAQFNRDDATGEWRIPVFVRGPDGRGIRLDALRQEPLVRVIRRREKRALPWPARQAAEMGA